MSTDETSGGRSGSVLAGLLAPLRLPERVLEALDQLRPMRAELTRVREQTEPLADLLPALQRLEKDLGTRLEVLAPVDERLATIERTIDELAGAVGAIHETLVGVKDEIQRTTGLRGDRGVAAQGSSVVWAASGRSARL